MTGLDRRLLRIEAKQFLFLCRGVALGLTGRKLLANTGRLAGTLTQKVKLGAAHIATTLHFNARNQR